MEKSTEALLKTANDKAKKELQHHVINSINPADRVLIRAQSGRYRIEKILCLGDGESSFIPVCITLRICIAHRWYRRKIDTLIPEDWVRFVADEEKAQDSLD